MPLRGITDQEGTLEDYCFALSEFESDAIWNTVNNLRSGKIDEASKDFCPKAPKLAEYVRAEQKRIDLLRAPKPLPYTPVSQGFKDWRIIHHNEIEKLKAKGFSCLATEISLEECNLRARRKSLPAGTVWFWSVQQAWGPTQ